MMRSKIQREGKFVFYRVGCKMRDCGIEYV